MMPIQYRLELLDIYYNHMHRTNDFPESWPCSYVHLVNKPDGLRLRPIAMTSRLFKIYEILVKNRLQWFCENRCIFSNSQSGFRKGRSCNDNLINLAMYIETGFQKGKDTLAAFLDVQGAFDNVNSTILIEKLKQIGVSESILSFIQHLKFQRKIYSEYNRSQPCYSCKGVPQGGVLSSLLYLIYVVGITLEVSKFVKISQFADDIAVYINVKLFKKAKNLSRKAVDIICTNLRSIGLHLSLVKTKLVHFNNKGILHHTFSLGM